jgi:type IV pilus assembly protein PilB
MNHTHEADAFLRTILNDPADPLPRLVFADWLEETGTRSNFAWAKYLRISEDVASPSQNPFERARKTRLAERIGNLIQAKLRYKAEIFLAHPEAMRRVLPLKCMALDVETVVIPQSVAEILPESIAYEFAVLPLLYTDSTVTVTGAELNEEARSSIEFIVSRKVEWIPSASERFQETLQRAYPGSQNEDFHSTLSFDFAPAQNRPAQAAPTTTPVERIVELFLSDASADGIRDITIRRAGPRVEIRFCRNGGTPLWGGFPSSVHVPLVNHIRRLAKLPDSYEEQSGIFRYPLGNSFVDVALRITQGVSGAQMHLTILPYLSEPPVSAMSVA